MDLLWSLPGPRAFRQRVGSAAAAGSSVIVVAPSATTPTRLDEQVEEACGAAGRWPRELPASQILQAPSLSQALADGLRLERRVAGQAWTPLLIAEHPDTERRTVVMDVRGVATGLLDRWREFLTAYAAAARSVDSEWRCTFVTLATADLLPPGTRRDRDVLLQVEWWWGVIGRLDSLVAAHDLDTAADRDPLQRAMVAEIAAFDLALIPHLYDRWDFEVASLPEVVGDYGRAAGIEQGEVPERRCVSGRPHDDLLAAWNRRLVERWDGDDPCLHAANDAAAGLQRRVWAGQAAALFPKLETTRHRLASWMDRQPPLVRDQYRDLDPFAMEIGAMWDVIKRVGPLRNDERRRKLASWLHDARNMLAHLEPLEAARIGDGYRLMAAAW